MLTHKNYNFIFSEIPGKRVYTQCLITKGDEVISKAKSSFDDSAYTKIFDIEPGRIKYRNASRKALERGRFNMEFRLEIFDKFDGIDINRLYTPLNS